MMMILHHLLPQLLHFFSWSLNIDESNIKGENLVQKFLLGNKPQKERVVVGEKTVIKKLDFQKILVMRFLAIKKMILMTAFLK